MAETPRVLGYLKSLYPYASDTFVRNEVAQLRSLGFTVHPFSVRRPSADMVVSDDIAQEQARTEYLLDRPLTLLVSGLLMSLRHPLRMLAALGLAMRSSGPGLKARGRQLAYLLEAALLARRMRARGVQHLHNHIGDNSAAVAMLASLLSGIRYSLTIHGPKEFDRPQYLALHEKIARAAFVVAISEFGRSQLMRWSHPDHWHKIHVVRCGVDEQFLAQTPTTPPEAARFVCVGRLCPEKGQLLLVQAVHQLREQGVHAQVVLVGDGPSRRDIEAMVGALGVQDQVQITGWASSEQVRRHIIGSRALVLPSFAEGLPVVLMEAMALHRPVISTYIAGIPELVEPGVNGWLVPAGSIEALTCAMCQAIQCPPQGLAEMGREGAARVRQQHSIANEVAKLAALLSTESLCAAHTCTVAAETE